MNLEQAIQYLKEYIELDRKMRSPKEDWSDYDEFCEKKNIAIETLINELE